MSEQISDRPCRVPLCPALALRHSQTCRYHSFAALAKETGAAGHSCKDCKRKIGRTDWVHRIGEHVDGVTYWRHVSCDPPKPRRSARTVKESDKPLLDAL